MTYKFDGLFDFVELFIGDIYVSARHEPRDAKNGANHGSKNRRKQLGGH